MSIKNDYERLIHYAKGLGLQIIFKEYKRGDPAAEWTLDGSEIYIYRSKNTSITSYVLTLLHELAHHESFIYRGRINPQGMEKATAKELEEKPLNEEDRKAIYHFERRDSEFQIGIWEALNLSIPKYKVLAEKDLSNWGYMIYWKKGKDPTQKQFEKKRKKLREKYKEKK